MGAFCGSLRKLRAKRKEVTRKVLHAWAGCVQTNAGIAAHFMRTWSFSQAAAAQPDAIEEVVMEGARVDSPLCT